MRKMKDSGPDRARVIISTAWYRRWWCFGIFKFQVRGSAPVAAKQRRSGASGETRPHRDGFHPRRRHSVSNVSTVIPAPGVRWFRDQRRNGVALKLTRSKLFTSSLPLTSRHTPVWGGGPARYGHRDGPNRAGPGWNVTNHNTGDTPSPPVIGYRRGWGGNPSFP